MQELEERAPRRRFRRWSQLACALAGSATLACGAVPGFDTVTDKLQKLWDRLPFAEANVAWESATPEQAELSSQQLDVLWDGLAEYDTRALLVARDGRLVYERYAAGSGANRRLPVAAAAKGVVAGIATQLVVADGLASIDDRVERFVPEYRDDPERSPITIRHLLTHSSGIENVSFSTEQTGWKAEYKEDRPGRFKMAMFRAPMRFAPGSRYEYSGVGFHVLAYALARALEGSPYPDFTALLGERIMQPLGIPSRAWTLSYRERYPVDGMQLQAIGSGSEFTPRAFARIGQLLLDEGRFGDEQLLPAQGVREMLRYAGSPPQRPLDSQVPGMGLTPWVNCDAYWPSLPPDAAVIAGARHQIILMIPSLDLLVVRLGERFGEATWFGDYWSALTSGLFDPLAAMLPKVGAEPAVRCEAAAELAAKPATGA